VGGVGYPMADKKKNNDRFWTLGVAEPPPGALRGGSAAPMGKPSNFFFYGFGP
jgi:hypothetical protein